MSGGIYESDFSRRRDDDKSLWLRGENAVNVNNLLFDSLCTNSIFIPQKKEKNTKQEIV